MHNKKSKKNKSSVISDLEKEEVLLNIEKLRETEQNLLDAEKTLKTKMFVVKEPFFLTKKNVAKYNQTRQELLDSWIKIEDYRREIANLINIERKKVGEKEHVVLLEVRPVILPLHGK